ncbi:MAG: HEAT repeat domain-containing protein [Pirellulales bacterium]
MAIVVAGQAAGQEQSPAVRPKTSSAASEGDPQPPANAEKRVEAARTDPQGADGPRVAKEDLRYAGRSFDEWRRQLLTDLEPKTQIAAIEALAAFGTKGYESETAAALSQVLGSKFDQVRWSAFSALATLGPASVPILLDALRSDNPQARGSAAAALAQVSPAADAALDPLRQAIQDEDRSVRLAAARSLAKLGAGEKRLLPVFEQLARSADVEMRQTIVRGLSEAGGDAPRLLPLFLRELDDDDWQTRAAAGRALVRYGPASREVIEGLTELAREDISRVRLRQQFDTTVGSFVRTLSREEKNLDTVAPVVIEAASVVLTDPVYARSSLVGDVLAALARLGPKGAAAVPALAQFIAIESPAGDESIVLAIDILRAIGPAAREAIPALESWLAQRAKANGDLPSIQKHALKAIQKIKD